MVTNYSNRLEKFYLGGLGVAENESAVRIPILKMADSKWWF